DHAVQCVQAGAADADHADHREVGGALAYPLEPGGVPRERLEPARRRPLGLGLRGRGRSTLRLGRTRGLLLLGGVPLGLGVLAALRRLGCTEELRERALTHAGALSRHGAPPWPGLGTSRPPRRSVRTRAPRTP